MASGPACDDLASSLSCADGRHDADLDSQRVVLGIAIGVDHNALPHPQLGRGHLLLVTRNRSLSVEANGHRLAVSLLDFDLRVSVLGQRADNTEIVVGASR